MNDSKNANILSILKKTQLYNKSGVTISGDTNERNRHHSKLDVNRKQPQQQQQQQQQTNKTLIDKEEEEIRERDRHILNERVYVDNATPLVSSIFTSLFTVTILYSISTPKDLWVLVFFIIDITFTVIKTLIAKYYFSRLETDDLDNLIIMQFFRFIHTTITLMLMKILLDIMTFIVLTSTMYWYNYLDVGMFVLTAIFVVFSKIK